MTNQLYLVVDECSIYGGYDDEAKAKEIVKKKTKAAEANAKAWQIWEEKSSEAFERLFPERVEKNVPFTPGSTLLVIVRRTFQGMTKEDKDRWTAASGSQPLQVPLGPFKIWPIELNSWLQKPITLEDCSG